MKTNISATTYREIPGIPRLVVARSRLPLACAGTAAVAALLVAGCGGSSSGRMRAATRPAPVTNPTRPASPSRHPRRFTIGHSVQGRPIDAYQLGQAGSARPILVVGCIHGNEPAGIAIASRLLHAKPPPGSSLWVVPELNPDGVRAHTRQNADGVDLNRNFPRHWR